MEEATFSAWLKQEGEWVQAGDPLFTLESDKATQDVEALDSGFLRLLPHGPRTGTTVKVGATLALLAATDEDTTAHTPGNAAAGSAANAVPGTSSPAARHLTSPLVPAASAPVVTAAALPTISPRALRVAAELGVEWKTVAGTGRTGRIRETDIRRAAGDTSRRGGPVPGTDDALPAFASLSPARRVIARRMLQSVRHTAPVTLHTTVDATALVEFRRDLKSAAGPATTALIPSVTDVLLKLTVAALREHPALNARWAGEDLLLSAEIHLGLAIDTPAGLVVPVIRNAARLSLAELTARTRELANRARTRRLSAEELQDGTFTVTNLGSWGIDAFTPILNYPECAILGIGSIRRQPAVVGNEICPRDLLSLSLTFDHCALDGAPAACFLQTLRRQIETLQPNLG